MEEELTEIRKEPWRTQDHGQGDHASGKWPIHKRTQDVILCLRGRIGSIVWFALAVELLRFLVLAPVGASTLRVFLERWGRCSVGNFEVLAFLLSPPGLAALVAIGAIALTSFYLEIGGLLVLLADRRGTIGSTVTTLGRRFFRLLALGLCRYLWAGTYSKNASKIELLFFDAVEADRPARVIPLDRQGHRTYHDWHVCVPGTKPGQLYGYRVYGPCDPARGRRFHPQKAASRTAPLWYLP